MTDQIDLPGCKEEKVPTVTFKNPQGVTFTRSLEEWEQMNARARKMKHSHPRRGELR